MSSFLRDLRRRAADLDRRIVFAEGADPRIVRAAIAGAHERLFRPVLLGGDEVDRLVEEYGGESLNINVADPARDPRADRLARRLYQRRSARGMTRERAAERVREPLIFGALLVADGEADGSVAGAVYATGDVLRAGLWGVGPAPGIRTVSSAFYMVVPGFPGNGEHAVLSFADAGVVPNPDAAQLAEIAEAAVRARRSVVGDEPRVAFLSYSTLGSAGGPSVHRVREALERFRERMPEVAAAGELQADAALVPEVAARKAPGVPGAGDANVLIFPDLDAGNIAYKLVQRLANAEAVGPIVQGLARPCNDLSRGASEDDIVNAACITALMSRESGTPEIISSERNERA